MEIFRHVGYQQPKEEMEYFSLKNIQCIQDQIARYFWPRQVEIKTDVIRSLLEKNYYDYKPPQTDIFSAFQIQPLTSADKFTRAREISLNMLIETVRAEIAARQMAKTLDIEIIKYTGELRATPKPKLKEKRVPPMLFNMNY